MVTSGRITHSKLFYTSLKHKSLNCNLQAESRITLPDRTQSTANATKQTVCHLLEFSVTSSVRGTLRPAAHVQQCLHTIHSIQQRGKTSARGMDTVMAMTTEQCSKTSVRVKQCLQTTKYFQQCSKTSVRVKQCLQTTKYIQQCSKTSVRVKQCLQTTEYIQRCSKTSVRGMATKMEMEMQMKDWPSWGTGSALPLQQRNVWLPLDEMVRGWTTEPVSDSSSQQ